jgi:hypothetical protein
MVNDQTAPTIASLTKNGVQFTNTHSIFPTFTTANASAMATGHALGDTGLRASDQSRSGKSSRPDWDVNEFPRKTAWNSHPEISGTEQITSFRALRRFSDSRRRDIGGAAA